MSLWQFKAAIGGAMKSRAGDEAGISTEEAVKLAAFLDEAPVWH